MLKIHSFPFLVYVSIVNWILLTVFVSFLKYQSMKVQQPTVSKRKYYIVFMIEKNSSVASNARDVTPFTPFMR